MKNQTQILENLEIYVSFMKSRGDEGVTLGTDRGTEYISSEIQSFLIVTGIVHALTGRVAHTKMHVPERMNS